VLWDQRDPFDGEDQPPLIEASLPARAYTTSGAEHR